jgi:hypothetical protein
MAAISGRFAEARLYLVYAVSPLRPGVEMPTFREPRPFKWDLDSQLTVDDLKVIVDEGRRQIDRQLADLERLRGRAGALVTLCLVELAALSAGASRIFGSAPLTAVWSLSAMAVLLALGGALALLSAQAKFGRTDTMGLAASKSQVHRVAALSYAKSVSQGEETIATRVTVFRDAVLLAIMGAILYAVVWPATTLSTFNEKPSPAATGEQACPTCTPSSPSLPASPVTTSPISPSLAPPSPNP